NARYNERLEARLREMNREIEQHNQRIERQKRTLRNETLQAIRSELPNMPQDPRGRAAGREATARIVPYYRAFRREAGVVPLLVTSLALYTGSPDWVDELLWYELRRARADELARARMLLRSAAERYQGADKAIRALIYT